MANSIKTKKDDILNAVMEIIDESGFDRVTARSVADKLGISTQPIYREFKDMNELAAGAERRGWEIFKEYTSGDALTGAVGYVIFAVEKGNLFKFLFRGRRYEYDGLDDLSHKLVSEDIIDKLEAITELPREKVYRVHLCVWMALHGLASVFADNKSVINSDEIKELTRDMTVALTKYLKEGNEE